MNQVKVKAYGLIDFTKKQYIIIQLIGFGILGFLFLLSFLYDLDRFLFGNAKVVLVVIIFLECIETFFMYKKFKEKENNINNK